MSPIICYKQPHCNQSGRLFVNNSREELLKMKIDSQLSSESYGSSLFEKSSQTFRAISRITNQLQLEKTMYWRKHLWNLNLIIAHLLEYCISENWKFALIELIKKFWDSCIMITNLPLNKDISVIVHHRYWNI